MTRRTRAPSQVTSTALRAFDLDPASRRSTVSSAARTSSAIRVRSHTAGSTGILPASSRLTSSRSLIIRPSSSLDSIA